MPTVEAAPTVVDEDLEKEKALRKEASSQCEDLREKLEEKMELVGSLEEAKRTLESRMTQALDEVSGHAERADQAEVQVRDLQEALTQQNAAQEALNEEPQDGARWENKASPSSCACQEQAAWAAKEGL